MRLTIDTNIVLDVLGRREPFFKNSQTVMQLVAEGKAEGSITATSLTDIYYILRKSLDDETLRAALRGLIELMDIAEVSGDDCLAALDLPMADYEDALLACCARRWKADYIVTRNIKDFTGAPIKAVTPVDLLNEIMPK